MMRRARERQDKEVWELRKVKLYGDNPSIQSQIASGELQGVHGGRGELRSPGGETDTYSVFIC